ncbi:MAG: gliding motility-associated-like protein, partial [Arenicella sp.]
DGNNDFFTFDFRAQAVTQFNCVIVNRWGTVVHEMNAITDQWNGTDKNGSTCNDGTYFYTYEGEAENGETFAGQGTVNIFNGQ